MLARVCMLAEFLQKMRLVNPMCSVYHVILKLCCSLPLGHKASMWHKGGTMVKESTQHIPGDTAMSYLELDRAGQGRRVWKLRVKLWTAALQVASNI